MPVTTLATATHCDPLLLPPSDLARSAGILQATRCPKQGAGLATPGPGRLCPNEQCGPVYHLRFLRSGGRGSQTWIQQSQACYKAKWSLLTGLSCNAFDYAAQSRQPGSAVRYHLQPLTLMLSRILPSLVSGYSPEPSK